MSPFRILTATVVAASLAACGSSASSSSSSSSSAASSSKAPAATGASSPAAKRAAVSISGFAFHPATVTVAPGAQVTFTNHDQTAHTATSTQPAFDTGTVAPGASHTVVLRHPGTYTYYCQFHAFMRATIVVR